MPLPKPKKDEKKKEFIDRCMSSKIMKKDFKETDQRFAVCSKLWKEKNGRK